MDEYQEYLRMFGDLPFGMRPKFEDYQKQRGAQTARNTFSSELQKGNLDTAYKEGYEKLPLNGPITLWRGTCHWRSISHIRDTRVR
jgi:hypothetical protein